MSRLRDMFAHVRAYAIRPYWFLVEINNSPFLSFLTRTGRIEAVYLRIERLIGEWLPLKLFVKHFAVNADIFLRINIVIELQGMLISLVGSTAVELIKTFLHHFGHCVGVKI